MLRYKLTARLTTRLTIRLVRPIRYRYSNLIITPLEVSSYIALLDVIDIRVTTINLITLSRLILYTNSLTI